MRKTLLSWLFILPPISVVSLALWWCSPLRKKREMGDNKEIFFALIAVIIIIISFLIYRSYHPYIPFLDDGPSANPDIY